MNELTDEQLAAVKEAMESGIGLRKFLKDEEWDIKPRLVRIQLNQKYGMETMRNINQTMMIERFIPAMQQRLNLLISSPAMKGKKTKFKSDLKAMINKL